MKRTNNLFHHPTIPNSIKQGTANITATTQPEDNARTLRIVMLGPDNDDGAGQIVFKPHNHVSDSLIAFERMSNACSNASHTIQHTHTHTSLICYFLKPTGCLVWKRRIDKSTRRKRMVSTPGPQQPCPLSNLSQAHQTIGRQSNRTGSPATRTYRSLS